MDIVFVGTFGLAPKSTMKARALPLAKALVRRGHNVTMVLPPWDNPQDAGARWIEDGVSIVNVALPPKLPLAWYGLLSWRLLREVSAATPDIVHSFKPKGFSGAVAQALLARRNGAHSPRVVVDTDDWEEGWNERKAYPWWQRQVFSYQERWLLRHSDAITAASRTLAELATSARGSDAQVVYVPNGTDGIMPKAAKAQVDALRQRLGIPEGPVLLLYTRFVECPPERMVDLLHAIARRGTRPTVLLVGAGLQGEEKTFLTHATESELPLSIVPAGWVDYQALPSYFALADAALFPMEDTLLNRSKCPARLVDLLSAGVPVAGEAVGQMKEYIVDGESGLLAPPGDLEALADAAVRLLQEEQLRTALGRDAQTHITRAFHWDLLASTLEKAYTG